MKKNIVFLILFIGSFSAIAQENPTEISFKKNTFVNMTEFGLMFGRTKSPTYYYPPWYSYRPIDYEEQYAVNNVVNLTLQTFNGLQVTEKTAAGITTGIDWYNATLVVPVQAGVRYKLVEKKKEGTALMAGLDAGYGTTWLHIDNTDTKTEGGLTVSPTVGFRLPMRGGSAWLVNFGYKYQHLTVTQTSSTDPYFSSIEQRNHHRMIIRMGIAF